MRCPRLKVSQTDAVYHCISRTPGGLMLLDDVAKEQFRKFLWQVVDFCGVELITYTILDNHFHLLIRVPAPGEISEEELARRVITYFGAESSYTLAIQQDLQETGKISSQLRQRLLSRMGDLSMCLKELKERFTRWFNRAHDRYGTLWAERFKSLLVEQKPFAVQLLAAYIDLNCVRAGIVDDPKDYRFCGYAEALVNSGKPRQGLAKYLEGPSWAEQSAQYRSFLFCYAAVSGHSEKRALDRKTIHQKLDSGGVLSTAEVLRLKIRYFTDGAVLGSKIFVDEVFVQYQRHFGQKRQTGARPMQGAAWQDLMVLRKLRLRVFA
jgi:putative transposase